MGEREGERAAKRGTEPKGGNRKASKEGGDRCGDRLVRTRVARVFRLFCARERKKERRKEEKNETGFFVQGGEERRRRTSATMQSAQDQQLKTFWDQQMQEVKEVPTGKNKEDYEVRRGCSYDKCRGSCVVCKGVRAFHTGADLEVVDALRREQEKNAAKE